MYSIKIQLPADIEAAGTGAQLRSRFRNSVGTGMRRDMQDAADQAQAGTQYPPAKAGYSVSQLTDVGEGSFSMGISNSAPAFGYTQGYRGKQPPSGKGSRLAGWAFDRGLPPFPVARKLGYWGSLDAGQFKRLWEQETPRLLERAAQRAHDFAAKWGNL